MDYATLVGGSVWHGGCKMSRKPQDTCLQDWRCGDSCEGIHWDTACKTGGVEIVAKKFAGSSAAVKFENLNQPPETDKTPKTSLSVYLKVSV